MMETGDPTMTHHPRLSDIISLESLSFSLPTKSVSFRVRLTQYFRHFILLVYLFRPFL